MKTVSKQPWFEAYGSRFAESAFGNDAIGLFALSLVYSIEDIEAVAVECINGGGDDKCCDIAYINKEEKIAVIAQCYVASDMSRASAPSKKADDLNIAVNWLLNVNQAELPESIKASALELRDAIKGNHINEIQIWYVHNLPESRNVEIALSAAAQSALAHIKVINPTISINVISQEIGAQTFVRIFEESRAPILVSDRYEFSVPFAEKIEGSKWSAVVCAIKGSDLQSLYREHKTKLFSANVRDYLGLIKNDSNINFGIKQTSDSNPGDFWVYNNGITALVNDIEIKKLRNGRKKLVISGISIVNGAQTTGTIGNIVEDVSKKLQIPVRFVKVSDEEIVYDIIKFNNSQNKVSASDFRSTDPVQRRLKQEFSLIPDAEYEAGRRGGASSAIRRRPNLMPSYTVGQALTAFHGDPVTAYEQKQEIWIDDRLYSKIFNDGTTASHLICVYALLRNISDRKADVVTRKKKNDGSLTALEIELASFFEQKASVHLLTTAVADCLETILSKNIPNKFSINFSKNISLKDAIAYWSPVVEVAQSLVSQLDDAFVNRRVRADRVASAISKFKGVFQAVRIPNKSIFDQFSKKIESSC